MFHIKLATVLHVAATASLLVGYACLRTGDLAGGIVFPILAMALEVHATIRQYR